MAAPKLNYRPQAVEPQGHLLYDYDITDIVDLEATKAEILRRADEIYNRNRAAAKASGNTSLVLDKLLTVFVASMRRLRREQPRNYLYYLTQGDVIRVDTCPAQLCAMCGSFIRNKQQVKNHLQILEHSDIGFILRKRHTSRVSMTIRNEDGSTTTVRQETEEGRGEVSYYLSKELFTFAYKLVGLSEKSLKTAENDPKKTIFDRETNFSQRAENQPLRGVSATFNTQPLNGVNIKTPIKTSQIPDKIKGTASPVNFLSSPPIGGIIENGNEPGSNHAAAEIQTSGAKKSEKSEKISGRAANDARHPGVIAAAKKYENSGKSLKINDLLPKVPIEPQKDRSGAIVVSPEQFAQYREQKRGDKLRALRAFDAKIERVIPNSPLAQHAFLAWSLCRKLLFSHLSDFYLDQCDQQARYWMQLQIERLQHQLGLELTPAYQLIVKGIEKHAKARKKRKDSFIYAPTTYLDTTSDYAGGTLKWVIDEWVIGDYVKMLKVHTGDENQRLRYAYAHRFGDKLFGEIVAEIKGNTAVGFSAVSRRIQTDYYPRRIANWGKKNGIGQKSLDNITAGLMMKANALLSELKRRKDLPGGIDPILAGIRKMKAATEAKTKS